MSAETLLHSLPKADSGGLLGTFQTPSRAKGGGSIEELLRGGYLHDEPAVALVAEVLSDVEAGEPRPQPQGPRPAAPDE